MTDLQQLLASLAAASAFVAFVGAAIANVLFSRPRIDALRADRDADRARMDGLQTQNTEQAGQITLLTTTLRQPLAVTELAEWGARTAERADLKAQERHDALLRELAETRRAATQEHAALLEGIAKLGERRAASRG